METKNTQKVINNVSLFNRERLEITGIIEVLSSTDKEIVAKLDGSVMYIYGNGMTISKLIPEDELLVVSGKIDGLKYESKQTKKSFLKRVFK